LNFSFKQVVLSINPACILSSSGKFYLTAFWKENSKLKWLWNSKRNL